MDTLGILWLVCWFDTKRNLSGSCDWQMYSHGGIVGRIKIGWIKKKTKKTVWQWIQHVSDLHSHLSHCQVFSSTFFNSLDLRFDISLIFSRWKRKKKPFLWADWRKLTFPPLFPSFDCDSQLCFSTGRVAIAALKGNRRNNIPRCKDTEWETQCF